MKWKKKGFIAAIILAPILIFIIVAGKLWLKSPSQYDYFFFDVAADFNAPDICEKIDSWSYGQNRFGAYLDIYYFRSRCYENLALKLHNPDLCNQIIPLRTIFLDGSRFKEQCFSEVEMGGGLGGTDSIYYISRYDRDKMIRLTGFSDYFRLKNGPASEKEKFLEAVRKF